LNSSSVCNKASSLCEYIKDNSLDIFGITETWLKQRDQTVIAELTPPGYTMQHIPRSSGRGVVLPLYTETVSRWYPLFPTPISHLSILRGR
jgi:hypothetical protein